MENENSTNKNRWYAIYTKPRGEKKVNEFLEKEDLKCYLPLKRNYHKNTKAVSLVPLIPSYCFINSVMTYDLWYKIVNQKNVIAFIGKGNKPEPIADHEIESLIKIVEQSHATNGELILDSLNYSGKEIIITKGPFAGFRGRVESVSKSRKKITVNIDNIKSSISLEVDINLIKETVND